MVKERAYKLKSPDKWKGKEPYKGGRMVWMSPDAYLSRVPPLLNTPSDTKLIEQKHRKLAAGEKMKPLAIYSNGMPNGRHRATAAKALGIKRVPVLVGGKEPPKFNGKLAVKGVK